MKLFGIIISGDGFTGTIHAGCFGTMTGSDGYLGTMGMNCKGVIYTGCKGVMGPGSD